MNETISKLAEQCRSLYRDGNGQYVEQFDEEKFAELIVKECMTMCDETRSEYFKYRKASNDFTDKNIYAEGESASDIIKYKMKKHFGVEK